MLPSVQADVRKFCVLASFCYLTETSGSWSWMPKSAAPDLTALCNLQLPICAPLPRTPKFCSCFKVNKEAVGHEVCPRTEAAALVLNSPASTERWISFKSISPGSESNTCLTHLEVTAHSFTSCIQYIQIHMLAAI